MINNMISEDGTPKPMPVQDDSIGKCLMTYRFFYFSWLSWFVQLKKKKKKKRKKNS